MTPTPQFPLLHDADLARIAGGATRLDLDLRVPPVRAQVGLTATGPHSSVSGSLVTDGRAWSGGLRGTLHPGPKVGMEASCHTDGRAWEAQVGVRIRFCRA